MSDSKNIQEEITHQDVKISEHERLFERYRKVDKFLFTHRTMNPDAEEWLPIIDRELVRCHKAAAVLLYDPVSDSLLLSKQFRLGVILAGYDEPYMIECAAGVIDPGETPEETAVRESFEETGATVTELEYVARSFPSAGSNDEVVYLYCGCIDGIPDERYHGILEEGEEIETFVVPASEAEDLLVTDKVQHASTLTLLNWFLRHHDRLQKKWGGDKS